MKEFYSTNLLTFQFFERVAVSRKATIPSFPLGRDRLRVQP